MEERALPGSGRLFSTRRGQLSLFTTGPMLVVEFADFGEGDFATPIMAAFDEILKAGQKAEIFFAMGKMDNYDSALRTKLTSHFAGRRSDIASFHVFAKSRLVTMGVSVANLALGRLITVHANHSSFVKALEATARRHRAVGISGTLLSAS
ncbi:MAG: hypothetical protein ABW133_03700 [Polyangiaceae bacterium]